MAFQRLFPKSVNVVCIVKIIFRPISIIHDKNFEYFRNKVEYKNSAIQMTNLELAKTKNLRFLFPSKDDFEISELLAYLEKRENVMKLSISQVKDVMNFMANMELESIHNSLALKHLDEKCAISAEKWSLALSLYILDAWFVILGPKMFRKHYYSIVKSLWSRKINRCTKFNAVQILYYIGMGKRPIPLLMDILEDKMEDFISDMSDEEIAIACLSFFKTSTRIKSELLLGKCCLAAENLLHKNERFHLISILKCLRLSQYYNPKLLDMLKQYVIREVGTFNYVECTNFLAVFASQNIYNSNVFSLLENQGIHCLSMEGNKFNTKEHPSLKSRGKDLARFLWAMASTAHSPKQENVDTICYILLHKIDQGEFLMQQHVIVDCIQSLALIGCYPESILQKTFTSSLFEELKYSYRDKPKYQLHFVTKSIQIECHGFDKILQFQKQCLVNYNIPRNLHMDIKNRKGFQDFVDFLRQYLNTNIDFKCCYIMPHIMIAGIIIRKHENAMHKSKDVQDNYRYLIENGILSKSISNWIESNKNEVSYTCIEILDPSVCNRDSFEPIGLMKAKFRQLKLLKLHVVTLTSEQIDDILNMDILEKKDKIQSLIW